MPRREHTHQRPSSHPWGKAFGVLAVLVALAMVAMWTATAHAVRGGSAGQGAAAGPTITPWPTVSRVSASAGISRSVTVVGIGDSVTSGANCNCETFVSLYATGLTAQRGLTASAVNLGAGGWTSSNLLENLTRPGTFRDQVSKADVLLVTIGANDLIPLVPRQPKGCAADCYRPLVSSVARNVQQIVAAARATHPAHPPTILVTDYWNVFEDGDVGDADNGSDFQSWSDVLTRAEGAAVCGATKQAGATCVSLYGAFKGDGSKNPTTLLAPDGDHPSAAGHRVIASTLLAATPMPIP